VRTLLFSLLLCALYLFNLGCGDGKQGAVKPLEYGSPEEAKAEEERARARAAMEDKPIPEDP